MKAISRARFASAALGIVMLAGATGAAAQQCDVFTDVQASDSFCNSVQWLKNRGITTGCSQTAYCPANNVTRAQMALFMNRMGVAITPRWLNQQGTTPAQAVAEGGFLAVCASALFDAVNYPQIVRARAFVSIPANGPAMELGLVYSLNNAGYVNINAQRALVEPVSGQTNVGWHSGAFIVPPNTTIRFAAGIFNPAGSGGPLNLAAGRCVLAGESVSVNSATSPPFDADE